MKRKRTRFFRLIFFFTVFFVLIVTALYIDGNLRHILLESAENRVGLIMSDCANVAVNKAIKRCSVNYDDIIRVTRDADQNITSLQTDVIKLNLLRTEIDTCFSEEMSDKSTINMQIPVGTVLGSEYTLGRGPSVKYKLSVSVNTSTDYKSQFYSAGFNQTLHQITVCVSGEAYIMSAWYKDSVDFETEYIIAETIITGTVPNSLADFDVKK